VLHDFRNRLLGIGRPSLFVLTTEAVLIAATQDGRVCVFRSCASPPVAAAGTDNPKGLRQEPELPTRKNGNRKPEMYYGRSTRCTWVFVNRRKGKRNRRRARRQEERDPALCGLRRFYLVHDGAAPTASSADANSPVSIAIISRKYLSGSVSLSCAIAAPTMHSCHIEKKHKQALDAGQCAEGLAGISSFIVPWCPPGSVT
jgi:hypothetical protein